MYDCLRAVSSQSQEPCNIAHHEAHPTPVFLHPLHYLSYSLVDTHSSRGSGDNHRPHSPKSQLDPGLSWSIRLTLSMMIVSNASRSSALMPFSEEHIRPRWGQRLLIYYLGTLCLVLWLPEDRHWIWLFPLRLTARGPCEADPFFWSPLP